MVFLRTTGICKNRNVMDDGEFNLENGCYVHVPTYVYDHMCTEYVSQHSKANWHLGHSYVESLKKHPAGEPWNRAFQIFHLLHVDTC